MINKKITKRDIMDKLQEVTKIVEDTNNMSISMPNPLNKLINRVKTALSEVKYIRLYKLKSIGYSMETINKRTTTKEITEYFVKCSQCNKEIVGTSDSQVLFNLMVHKKSKGCVKA